MWQGCFFKCVVLSLLVHPLPEVNFSQVVHAHIVTLISVVTEWYFSTQFHKKKNTTNFKLNRKEIIKM